jgi:Uma2 family endonuclease
MQLTKHFGRAWISTKESRHVGLLRPTSQSRHSPVRSRSREAWAEVYREPDIIFNFAVNHAQRNKKYYDGGDLVMEVVNDDKRSQERDYDDKRRDYAKAGIPEYWIVDPAVKRVTVLALEGGAYVEHCHLVGSGTATSELLDGFAVDVAVVFEAGRA